MKKITKQVSDMGVSLEKIKNIEAPAGNFGPRGYNGELRVPFNKYNVVYSNNVTGNLWSQWRAGQTCISCYNGDSYVGVISFYETTENMHGGYIGPFGTVVIEYPISEFEDVMRILKTFTDLSLLFVERDTNGNQLPHPVGAVMTFQKKPIGG
jgi:hypothetical protein